MIVLILLQLLQVAILWLHDWAPLGPLNDPAAVQAQDARGRLVRVTVIQSLPFTLGLAFTVSFALSGHPRWIWTWLAVSYVVLFLGELRAWWVPYLGRAEPMRAARYQTMFGSTHSFLPMRNGITPNTLHCVLHLATVLTLVALAVLRL